MPKRIRYEQNPSLNIADLYLAELSRQASEPPPREPAPEPTISGEFVKAASAGVDNLQGAAYALGGIGADLIGADGARDYLLEGYARNQGEAAANAPAVPSYTDVDSGRKGLLYAAAGLGGLVPFAAGSLVSGGLGGVAGIAARGGAQAIAERAGKGLLESGAANYARRELGEEAATRLLQEQALAVGQRAVTKAGVQGATIGSAANSIGTESGLIYGDTYEKTGEYAPLTSLGLGTVAGALDVIPEVGLLKKALGQEARQGIGRELLTQVAKESLTEGAQTMVERAGPSLAGNVPYLTGDALTDTINSMIIGGLGGAAGAGAARTISSIRGGQPQAQPADETQGDPLTQALNRSINQRNEFAATRGLPAPQPIVAGFDSGESQTSESADRNAARIYADREAETARLAGATGAFADARGLPSPAAVAAGFDPGVTPAATSADRKTGLLYQARDNEEARRDGAFDGLARTAQSERDKQPITTEFTDVTPTAAGQLAAPPPAALPAPARTPIPEPGQAALPEPSTFSVDAQGNAKRGADTSRATPVTPAGQAITPAQRQELGTPSIDPRFAPRINEGSKAESPVVAGVAASEKAPTFQPFPAEEQSLGIPRAEMPQVKSTDRGALVNFLNARGVDHEIEQDLDPASLKPTQAEFSPEKVAQAESYTGGNRAIIVSSDGRILDGHHQWLAAKRAGKPVKAIVLDASASKALPLLREFPSSTLDNASSPSANQPVDSRVSLPDAEGRPAARLVARLARDPATREQHTFRAGDITDVPAEGPTRILSAGIARAFGKRVALVRFADRVPASARFGGATFDGNTLYVDADTKVPHQLVVFHELFHGMAKTDRALYDQLRAAAEPLLKGRAQYRQDANLEDEAAFDDGYVTEEMLADLFAERASTPEFWDGVASRLGPKKMKNLATKVREIIAKILGKVTGFNMGQYVTDLEKTSKLLERYTGDYLARNTSAQDVAPEQGRLAMSRRDRPGEIVNPEDRRTISTTKPTGKVRGVMSDASYTGKWVIDSKDIEATAKHAGAVDRALREYDTLLSDGDATAEARRAELVAVVKDNLIWLHDAVPAEIRERAKLWYDGANKIANDWAEIHDKDPRAIAGVLAALSPQMDWFKNVSLAERLINIHEKHGAEPWSSAMTEWTRSWAAAARTIDEKVARQAYLARAELLEGRTLSAMEPDDAALYIRAFDETYYERRYRMVTPEGAFADYVTKGSEEVDEDVDAEEGADDGSYASVTWGGMSTIAKGVKVLRANPGADLVKTIDLEMGLQHKVRNFYNNIIEPASADGDVTIDTHAVGAGLLKVVSGATAEVKQNLGGGAGQNTITGASGTYGLFADAYRDAASSRGILAREMQSITWEAIRALFPAAQKKGLRPKVDAIYKQLQSGEITREQSREMIKALGGDVSAVAWQGITDAKTAADGATSYDNNLDADPAKRAARVLEPKDAKDQMTIGLSAAQNSGESGIPGLQKLTAAAGKGDAYAARLLQDVAVSTLGNLLQGTSARLTVSNATGLYGGSSEPSAAITLKFTDTDRPAVLAALAKYAENLNQEQVHVRQGTKDKVGTTYPDGSYVTPVYRWEMSTALTAKQVQNVISKSGLFGLTFGDGFVEAYYVGENDEAAHRAFAEAAGKADELLGASARELSESRARLWPYGNGGGAIGFDRIRGDLPAAPRFNPELARRVAAYVGASAADRKSPPARLPAVKGFDQIKDASPEYTAREQLRAKQFSALPDNDLKRWFVRKAYNSLAKAVVEQYDVMPVKVEIWTAQGEPYANSDAMRRDVQDNNHLYTLATNADQFGPPGTDFSSHPLLKESGRRDINGRPLLFNDVLRAVHDYFAHNISASQFGPKGEDAAWKNHMASTPDAWARWALTAETKAQNSWQNFSPGAEKMAVKDRPFARQKAALLPLDQTLTGNRQIDAPVKALIDELKADGREAALNGSLPKGWDGKYVPDPDGNPFDSADQPLRYSRRKADVTVEKAAYGSYEAKVGSKVVGKAYPWTDSNGDFVMQNVRVSPNFRQRGVGTALYSEIERQTGKQLKPATSLSDDGFEFWKRYRPEAVANDLRHRKDELLGKRAMTRYGVGTIKTASGGAATVELDKPSENGGTIATLLRREVDAAIAAAGGDTVRFSRRNPQTETPEFKRWFGESKVVDEKGEPLVVYHGTDVAFDAFSDGPAFFTDSKPLADRYAQRRNGDTVVAAHLKIERPFVIDADGDSWDDINIGGMKAPRSDLAKILGPLRSSYPADDIAYALANNKQGYDGLVIRDVNDAPTGRAKKSTVYATLRPNQIKSATGNNGAFDPADDRITFSRRGNPQTATPEFKRWFRDGALVDDQGEPIRLYRGAEGSPETLKPGKEGGLGGGIYLTQDPSFASNYASETWLGAPRDNGAVSPYYVNLQKPLVIDRGRGDPVVAALVALGMPEAKAEAKVEKMQDAKGGPTTELRSAAQKQGYDGIVYRVGDVMQEVVAFNSFQLKSATGNSGAFSPNDDRVQFSRRGTIDPAKKEAFRKAGLGAAVDESTLADRVKAGVKAQTDRLDATVKDRLVEGLFDRFAPLRQAELRSAAAGKPIDVQQSAYLAARLATGSGSTVNASMLYGAPQLRDGVVQKKADSEGLLTVLDPVKDNLSGFTAWMVGKRATGLAAQGRENNLSPADIKQLLAEADGNEAQFEAVAKKLREYNNSILELARDAGLLTELQVRNYSQEKYYLPFFRVQDDDDAVAGFQGKRGLQSQTAGIKQLKGGTEELNDPIANLIANTARIVDASMKNAAMQRTIENFPDLVERQAADHPGAAAPKTNVQEGLVAVSMNGRKVVYKVHDPALLRAVSNLSIERIAGLGVFRAFKQLLTRTVTSLPTFLANNFVRDTMQTQIINRDGYTPIDALKGARETFRGLSDSTKASHELQAIAFAGASFIDGNIYGGSAEEASHALEAALKRKGFTKSQLDSVVSTPRKFLNLYSALSSASENGNRVATYRRARAAGKGVAQAAFESRDVMDFAMQGNYTFIRVMSDMLPFFNARLQGLYKLGRELKENPTGVAAKGMVLALASAALALSNDDDDRYKELPEWEKDTFWHIFNGDDHYRIPKPFELGLMFGTVPERMARGLFGDIQTGEDEKQAFGRALWSTLGLNPIPQAVLPVTEAAFNFDSFTQRPIDSKSDEGKLPEARYNDQTSMIMREIGEAFGVSPKRLQHVFEGYLGGVGAMLLSSGDAVIRRAMGQLPPAWEAQDIPVLGSFYRTGEPRSTRYGEDLYDMAAEADETYKTIRAYRSEGRTEEAQQMFDESRGLLASRTLLDKARTKLSAMRKQQAAVRADNSLSPEDKLARLQEIRTGINLLSSQVVQTSQQRAAVL